MTYSASRARSTASRWPAAPTSASWTIRRLREALPEPGHSQHVLPGVQGLLEALAPRADVFLALLTGNSEDGARLKLAHFDLWRFFRCGAYGDDVHERNALFDVAMQRARECGAPD